MVPIFINTQVCGGVGARRYEPADHCEKNHLMTMQEKVYDVAPSATASSCCDNSQRLSTSQGGHRVESMKHSILQHQRCVMNSSSACRYNPSSSCSPPACTVKNSIEYDSTPNLEPTIQSASDNLDSYTSSTQEKGKRQNKLVLLRRSVQFTTQLKSDPTVIDDTPNLLQSTEIETEDKKCRIESSPFLIDASSTRITHSFRDNSSNSLTISKPLDGAYDLFTLPTDISSASSLVASHVITSKNKTNVDIIGRRSSFSKIDLSSSWLSKDTASTSSTFSDQIDGAYDLFSLPSDSSISPSRCDSIRSLDYITSVDRLSLHDDISECSISKHRKVSFDSTVKAATIPSRLSYSSRMKTRLWSSTEDIYSNALRNEKEFAYDGCDWRTASEESDFLLCPFASSKLSDDVFVHPAHFFGVSKAQSILQQNRVFIRKDDAAAESESEIKASNSADEVAVDDNLGGIFDMD